MPFSCRYYSRKFPQLDETVMARVRTIGTLGAYVNLLEYNDLDAMILISELTRKRVRSLQKLLKIGRVECATVIRIDVEKRYVDLSKSRVTEADAKLCQQRYARARAVYSIIHSVAEKLDFTTDEELEDLLEKTAWYFEEKLKQPAAAFDVFKQSVENRALLDELDIDDETKSILYDVIVHRLSTGSVHVRTDIEVTCFERAGIDAIKSALKAGLSAATDGVLLKIQVIAAPAYVVFATTRDREAGLEVSNRALEWVEREILSHGGTFKVVSGPKIVDEGETETLEERPDDEDREDWNM